MLALTCPKCGKDLWFMRDFCPFCKSTIPVPARPRSVTVISLIFIVLGVVMLISLVSKGADWFHQGADKNSVYYVLTYLRTWAGPILAILCGVSMLRGLNWGRWLLILWCGNNILNSVLSTHRGQLLVSLSTLLLFAIVFLLLFRPAANAFFTRASDAPSKPENPPAPEPEPATGRTARRNDQKAGCG